MSDWAAVDDLIRELGSVRNAADKMNPTGHSKVALDSAIHDAALAISNLSAANQARFAWAGVHLDS